MTIKWICFGISAVFTVIGMAAFLSAMLGVSRFKFVLDRLHAVAVADTIGTACIAIACAVYMGCCFATVKELLTVALMGITSPVSTHIIADIEFKTSKLTFAGCRMTESVRSEAEAARESYDGAD